MESAEFSRQQAPGCGWFGHAPEPPPTLLFAALALPALSGMARADSPDNDDFAHRTSLPSSATVNLTSESNTGASMESGEVSPGGISNASVWYQWTPPTTGWYTVHTVAGDESRNLDTVLAVYTGSSLGSLQMLGFNDESNRVGDQQFGLGPSHLVFHATAGTSYKIAVYGYLYDTITQTGPFEFHIAPEYALDFKVLAASFSPTSVNVSASPATVQASVTVETSAAFASATFQAFTTNYNGPTKTITPSDIVSGTSTNGSYTVPLEIPLGMLNGVSIATVRSPSGDVWSPEGNDSYQDYALIPTTLGKLSVTNSVGTDIIGPFLSGFTGLPATVDVSAGAVPLTLGITATDDLSGFKEGEVVLSDGSVTYLLASFDVTALSGGTYVVSASIPAGFAASTYDATITLRDKLNNSRTFGPYGEELPSGANGNIIVTGAAGGYAAWVGTQDFGPGGEDGLLQDPNGDGTVNLLCYAFNLPPYLSPASVMTPGSGTAGLPSITTIGTGASLQLRIEFLRRKDAGNGLTYRAQFGNNLSDSGIGAWTDATITETPVEIDADWERVTVVDPVTGESPRFGRVVVEAAAP